MNTLITYDLKDATEEMHAKARELLEQKGWTRTVPARGGGVVHLPDTTFAGESAYSAAEVRDGIYNLLADAKLNPKRVAVSVNGVIEASSSG